MLSVALTRFFFSKMDQVDVYGLRTPIDYQCSNFYKVDLLDGNINYDNLVTSDVIIYAAGAGVQAALNTDSSLMYRLNVYVPIELTLELKKRGYKGVYISFGSYMEIGVNDEFEKSFTESEVVCSNLSVSNDYGLSKRLYSRYMKDLSVDYTYWHFILPNMFSVEDFKPGTRLIPYVLEYLQKYSKGESVKKPSYSSGLQRRQYVTLDEVLEIILISLTKKIQSGIYCVGGGEYLSVRNLIERMYAFYKVPCKDEYFGKEVRRDGDIKSLRLNGEKLFNMIGFLPTRKIEDLLLEYSTYK